MNRITKLTVVLAALGDISQARQFNAATNKPPGGSIYLKSTNCSAVFTVTAPVAIASSTVDYAGGSGSATLTANYAAVLPKKKNGSCNVNGNPLNQYTSITGTGTVSFGS